MRRGLGVYEERVKSVHVYEERVRAGHTLCILGISNPNSGIPHHLKSNSEVEGSGL